MYSRRMIVQRTVIGSKFSSGYSLVRQTLKDYLMKRAKKLSCKLWHTYVYSVTSSDRNEVLGTSNIAQCAR